MPRGHDEDTKSTNCSKTSCEHLIAVSTWGRNRQASPHMMVSPLGFPWDYPPFPYPPLPLPLCRHSSTRSPCGLGRHQFACSRMAAPHPSPQPSFEHLLADTDLGPISASKSSHELRYLTFTPPPRQRGRRSSRRASRCARKLVERGVQARARRRGLRHTNPTGHPKNPHTPHTPTHSPVIICLPGLVA